MPRTTLPRVAIRTLQASEYSQCHASTSLQPLVWARAFHISRSFRAEKDKKDKKPDFKDSFQGQLYGSTARRLQHERSEEARYAREMAKRNPQPVMKGIVLTIGTISLAHERASADLNQC
jgi:hypothetical protein